MQKTPYAQDKLIASFFFYLRNFKPSEQGESSMDQLSRTSVSLIPGHHTEFIVIGHNAYQWLLSIGTDIEGSTNNLFNI